MATTRYSELSGKKFYKVTNEAECHNKFQYKDGLNVLVEPFADRGSCVAGGFYFTDIEHILEYVDYGTNLRIVELPTTDSDFKCIKDANNKWRCNKIIFRDKISLADASGLKYVVDSGVDIQPYTKSLIEWSCKHGYLKVVQFLVNTGINFEIDNALCMACKYGQLDIVKYLVGIGANLSTRDNYPLIKSTKRGYLSTVEFLVESGIDFKTQNEYVLRLASRLGHTAIVKYFVEKGSNFRIYNDIAMRLAASAGHLDIVKYLVGTGADVKAANSVAVEWALRNGHSEVVKFLIEKGAKSLFKK